MALTSADFGPAAPRVSVAELARQCDELAAVPCLAESLDAYPDPVAVLNASRQIVLANESFAKAAGRSRDGLLGMRFGEALNCIHANDAPQGCGTGADCCYCGAALSMSVCELSRRPATQECRISTVGGPKPSALDLKVRSSPLVLADEGYLFIVAADVSAAKRRQVLERLFFHDALNTVGGIKGILEIWPDLPPQEAAQLRLRAQQLSSQLMEEIQAHRELMEAERGDLAVRPAEIHVRALLDSLRTLYGNHPSAEGKLITVCCDGSAELRADPVLLRRVLGNLVVNALEASRPGQAVTMTLAQNAPPVFEVHNDAEMPEAAKAQVFQRSFSTKDGDGRGIGTYSVRLLTERYLGGRVSFTSDAASGTTFRVRLPG
jgi:nitrogen-specific signal transduction histidine kinase